MRTVIVTASYRGDLERCRLLCESIDRHVSGHTRHLLLVENRDVPLFRPLAGPRREVVGEGDLLPFWLKPFPDPLRPTRRRLWLSPFGPPLRGWHVQQLRRVAIGTRLPEEIMLSCDSDVVFVKPFDVARMHEDGAVRFHRRAGATRTIIPEFAADHRRWWDQAGALLGLGPPGPPPIDYIATGIAWRTDTVRAMAERIAATGGRSFMRLLAGTRALSECTIYGRFADEVENRPGRHRPEHGSICRVYWAGKALDEAELARFVAALAPHEVAIGIQSFTGTPTRLIRRAAALD